MEKIPTITEWKGVRIDKMPRKDLEAEFAAVVQAYVVGPLERMKPTAPTKPPLDPQTMRCIGELRCMIRAIEAGEFSLRRFGDVLTEENDGLHRELALRATFVRPKASI